MQSDNKLRSRDNMTEEEQLEVLKLAIADDEFDDVDFTDGELAMKDVSIHMFDGYCGSELTAYATYVFKREKGSGISVHCIIDDNMNVRLWSDYNIRMKIHDKLAPLHHNNQAKITDYLKDKEFDVYGDNII